MADLPGNDIIDPNELKMHAGRAVTIDAPPEKVYPYLKQLGCDKAGFYSYDVLERLFGYHIYNDYAIEQKWQNPKVGDWIPYRQNGAGTGIVDMKENEYLIKARDSHKPPSDNRGITWHPKGFDYIAWMWNFYTVAVADGTKTRLLAAVSPFECLRPNGGAHFGSMRGRTRCGGCPPKST